MTVDPLEMVTRKVHVQMQVKSAKLMELVVRITIIINCQRMNVVLLAELDFSILNFLLILLF